MTEDHGEWTELLSEHLDGTLSPPETRRVEEHLALCAACAAVSRDLAEVVARARGLQDRAPVRDLWPAVREAVLREGPGGAVGGGRMAPGGRRGLATRKVTLTLPQLAAAAMLVVALAGSSAWYARPLAPLRDMDDQVAGRGSPEEISSAASTLGQGLAGAQAEEVARLESALAGGRDRLSPHTVRILERNLALIDRAIQESVEALALDPGNPFLEEHLRRAYRRRAEYVREATALLEAAD